MTTKIAKPTTTSTLEEATEVGYLGTVLDPTPNDEYTVGGGKTPETDAAAKKAAQSALDAQYETAPTVDPRKSSSSSSASSASS